MFDYSKVKSITIPEGNVTMLHVNGNLVWSGERYTELDYIIVPSAAWFNTGIIPTKDKWTYETEMYATSWGTNNYYYFAVRQTKYAVSLYCPIHVHSGYRIRIGSEDTPSAGGAKNTWVKIRSEVQDGLQNMWLNDVLKSTDTKAISYTYTYPLYLFAANYNGSKYQGVEGRIKYLRAYKGDELVRDFVAAKRESDGVYGLLDKVSGKFYTNAGTGTITGSS